MKRLFFIGNKYHKKTGSSDFLLRILEESFDVESCYVDLYKREGRWDVFSKASRFDFDVLVCWQVMPPRELLDDYFCFKHGAFFPMYDGCPNVKAIERWFPYRDFQIISFCCTLAEQLNRAGFSAHFIQYFPPPSSIAEWGDPVGVFFWNRRENINIQTVEKLLSEIDVRRVHIHKVLDPGCDFIPPSEQCRWEIEYSDWYETRAEMTSDILSSAYYIAPRHEEGIGMSVLEAMAMGRCVVAPDNPTMNEYIDHGRTGFLYDEKSPKALPLSQVREIQKNAYEYMMEGFGRWEEEIPLISKWLIEPVVISFPKMIARVILRFFRKPRRILQLIGSELSKRY